MFLRPDRLDGLLPLEFAIEGLRQHMFDYLEPVPQTVFGAIVTLCQRYTARVLDALDTMRILLPHTPQLEKVIQVYVSERQLISLAILLLLSKEVKALESSDNNETVSIHYCMKKEISSVIRKWNPYADFGHSPVITAHAINLDKKVLALVEVFEKCGDGIHAYIRSKDANVSEDKVANVLSDMFKQARIPFEIPSTGSQDTLATSVDHFSPPMHSPLLWDEKLSMLQKQASFQFHLKPHYLQPRRYYRQGFPHIRGAAMHTQSAKNFGRGLSSLATAASAFKRALQRF